MADQADGTQPGFIKRNWKYGLLALLFIPYLSFQAMKDRKAREAADAVTEQAADDVVPGLKVKLSKAGDKFVYQDGTELPQEGIGYAVLSWDDYQKAPDRFKKAGFVPNQPDFPIVVFFNLSGFDASGDPGIVRRAKDGALVFELKDRPKKPVANMSPLRDGTFRVTFRDGTTDTVKEEDWYRTYMGVEPAPKLPAASELDKMSPEELAKFGLTRMTKEEYAKKFGGQLPVPPPVPEAAGKTGIKGVVIQVGGVPAIQPLKDQTLLVLKGAVAPTTTEEAKKLAAGTATSGDNGGFSVAVPPGVYTVVLMKSDKLIGNAVNQAKWPSVQVGDGWTDYEFRVPPR